MAFHLSIPINTINKVLVLRAPVWYDISKSFICLCFFLFALSAEICEGDKIVKPTSNVASVAVGATLGCLILIVIIVYAVGRRMGSITDRTGYKAVE